MQGCCPHRDSPSSPRKIAAGILGTKSFQEMVLRFRNRNTGLPAHCSFATATIPTLFMVLSRIFCSSISLVTKQTERISRMSDELKLISLMRFRISPGVLGTSDRSIGLYERSPRLGCHSDR